MESSEPARPPGRGPAVRAAVLAATLAELADTGYAALTVENIARRAGVHKTTIYRRWTDRENLVADVLGERIAMDFPVPDTGSVEADLRQLAQAFVAWVTSPTGRMIFAAVYSDATRIPGISDVRRELFEYGPRRAAVVIERAIERGELPAGTDPAPVLRTLIAPIYFLLTVTAEPVDPAAADHAAQIALAAARAGVFRRPASGSPVAKRDVTHQQGRVRSPNQRLCARSQHATRRPLTAHSRQGGPASADGAGRAVAGRRLGEEGVSWLADSGAPAEVPLACTPSSDASGSAGS